MNLNMFRPARVKVLAGESLSLLEERDRLSRRIRALEEESSRLKSERDRIDQDFLEKTKLTDGGERLLPDGRTLHLTRVDVSAAVIERKPYSYFRWKIK